jgi:hypothetical protein
MTNQLPKHRQHRQGRSIKRRPRASRFSCSRIELRQSGRRRTHASWTEGKSSEQDGSTRQSSRQLRKRLTSSPSRMPQGKRLRLSDEGATLVVGGAGVTQIGEQARTTGCSSEERTTQCPSKKGATGAPVRGFHIETPECIQPPAWHTYNRGYKAVKLTKPLQKTASTTAMYRQEMRDPSCQLPLDIQIMTLSED